MYFNDLNNKKKKLYIRFIKFETPLPLNLKERFLLISFLFKKILFMTKICQFYLLIYCTLCIIII